MAGQSSDVPLGPITADKSADDVGSLQVRDDRVTLDALMLGDGAKDRTERSESEGMMVWNSNPVVRGLGGFQDDADLVHPRVLPFSAQELSEARTGNLARNLHATSRTSSRTR